MTTALGQWWFKEQANGSLIERNGKRGARLELIGQKLQPAGCRYFQGRPSATAESPYNPMASGGSNLAGSNPELDKAVAERVAALRAANPQASRQVPVELVTASASGLDYSLTPAAVAWQIPRVAAARQHDPRTEVEASWLQRNTQRKTAGQLHRHARGEYC